jgi:hypothetical protein
VLRLSSEDCIFIHPHPTNKKPQRVFSGANIAANTSARLPFFHPDCTVDPGISPGRAHLRLWVLTTDRDLEWNILTLPRRLSK